MKAEAPDVSSFPFLSPAAVARGHNVFIWSRSRTLLMLGLCIHEQSKLTIETLYRWLRLVTMNDPNTIEPHFVLRPVDVQPLFASYFCSCKFIPTGPDLAWNSKEFLQPGHYAAFSTPVESCSDLIFDTGRVLSFKKACASKPWIAKACQYPDWFDMWVRKRDGRCMITGSTTEPLVTTWIVPPFFTSVDYDGPVSFTPPPASENIYLTVNNGLTMRQDVADLFSNNDIAIDVDDNFRVVFMQEPSKLCSKELLAMIPSHISLPRGIQEELWVDLRMLRWHLRYTLLANGAADDVTLYYGQGKMAAVIDKLTGEYEGGDEVEDMEDLDNELWKSPIGQIYFAWLVFTKGMKD